MSKMYEGKDNTRTSDELKCACETTAGRSTIRSDRLPDWKKVGQRSRAAAAAREVAKMEVSKVML